MDSERHELTYVEIFRFWAPLAATWLMMAAEGPFLAAIIARLAEPKFNLAAFGVAFSFAMILQSPVIMIMTAATALARDRVSFRRMRVFAYGLSAAVTMLMLVVALPPIFDGIANRLIGLAEPVALLCHPAVVLLLPWPAAIGYRRLYQGVLIRAKLTRRVSLGTAVRLTSMAATGFVLYFFDVKGAYVGAAALSAGVVLEAVAVRWMTQAAVTALLADESHPPQRTPLTYRAIGAFYCPLALSSMLILGVHPVATFFVAQSRASVESLAVLPVVRSLVFVFACLGLSYQEVGVALLGEKEEGYARLSRFATALGVAVVAALSVIAFTSGADLWFHGFSGLSAELSRFAVLPTRILVLMPGLSVLLAFRRSVYVNSGRTRPITWSTAVEVAVIGVVLFVGIRYLDWVGAVAAAAAFLAGRLCANVWLHGAPSKPD